MVEDWVASNAWPLHLLRTAGGSAAGVASARCDGSTVAWSLQQSRGAYRVVFTISSVRTAGKPKSMLTTSVSHGPLHVGEQYNLCRSAGLGWHPLSTNVQPKLRSKSSSVLQMHATINGVMPSASALFGPALSSSSCLLYTSPSPRDQRGSRMPSSA